jgi:hypothetical protein
VKFENVIVGATATLGVAETPPLGKKIDELVDVFDPETMGWGEVLVLDSANADDAI